MSSSLQGSSQLLLLLCTLRRPPGPTWGPPGPFRFEGKHRTRLAEEGIAFMERVTDTLIVIPNQNIFQLIDQHTSLAESFRLADDVLLAGVRSVTDLMVTPGLINLDFADVQV